MPPRRSTRVTKAQESGPGTSRTRSKRPATSPARSAPAKRRARQSHDVHVEVQVSTKPRNVQKAGQERHDLITQSPQPLKRPAHERPCWQLFGWGNNLFSQLGMGEDGALYSELPRPTRNQLIEKLIAEGQFGETGAGLETIAAGAFHSLAISEDGAIWSFGSNEHAALGRSTQEDQDPTPRRIQSLVDEGFRAVRVVAGDGISAALSDQGTARAWGLYHSADADGGFKAFNPSIPKQLTPAPIPDLSEERFASIAAGSDHLVLLTLAGEVYTVGCGDSGQLGYRVPEKNPVLGTIPHKVLRHSRGHRAVIVGAGSSTSFFVDEQGNVWGWGLNHSGQTGTGKLPAAPRPGHEHDRKKVRNMIVWTPQRVRRVNRAELGGGATVVQIAGGEAHTLFLTSDGRVFACGSGWAGQLGGGQQLTDNVPEPVPVAFPHDVAEDPIVQVACGDRISAAVTRAGVLYTWGSNTTAQIGVKDAPKEVTTPTVVVRREGGWRAKVVACGSQHCIALLQKKVQ